MICLYIYIYSVYYKKKSNDYYDSKTFQPDYSNSEIGERRKQTMQHA